LSHFEADHVNGLEKLSRSATVKRIYAPHITTDQALHIIAQQFADGVQWTTEHQTFVSTLLAIARGEDVYGVPVTLILSEGGPPEQNREESVDNVDSSSIKVVSPQEKTASHSLRVKFLLTQSGAASTSKINAWELVHWCYASDKKLTDAILKKISSSVNNYLIQGQPGLCVNAKATDVAQTLIWFEKHQKEIAKAYKAATKEFNSLRIKAIPPKLGIPNNHNVASLCLYSGPVKTDSAVQKYGYSNGHTRYRYPCPFCEYRGSGEISWIATGDAMLTQSDIWDSFEKHFGKNRIEQCSTVLIPHHGADAKTSQNFNANLIRHGQNCVISAGAKNPYHHPHRNVVRAILDVPANVQMVTETNPQGFLERVEVRFH
jgi:hypothetical protein